MGKQKKRRKPKDKRQNESQQKPTLRDKLLLAAALIELVKNIIDLIRGK